MIVITKRFRKKKNICYVETQSSLKPIMQFMSTIISFTKKHWQRIAIAVAVVVVVGLVLQSMTSSEPLLSYRFLTKKAVRAKEGDVLPAGSYQPVTELPVGGTGAKLGTTTTWFSRGGMPGGMDQVGSAKDFTDPNQWEGFPRPGGDILVGGGLLGHGLLPEEDSAKNTSDLLDDGLALKPQLSSWKDGTRSRDQTLSSRGDVANPVGTGPSPEASVEESTGEETESAPKAATDASESFSMW